MDSSHTGGSVSYGEKVLNFVREVIEKYGPRLAGSKGEMKAGEHIYKLMSKFCDEVWKDWYVSRPRGFTDYIWVVFSLYLLGAISYFMGFWAAITVFAFIGLLVFILQQCLLYEVVDFLFPKVREFHVVGKILPRNKPKYRILLSAHYDSPYVFPLLSRLRMKSPYLILSTVAIVIATGLLGLLRYFYNVDLVQKPLLVMGSGLLFVIAAFLRSSKVSPGANDNLAGVGVVLEAGRYLSANRLKNTEVWIVAFAGEEHMRGSKRFVKKYFNELKDTILFNFECPSSDYFLVTTEEKMFFAKHSQKAVEIARKACEKVKADFKVGPLSFAGSDAANFSRKGLHATTIFGLALDGAPYYWHTLEDVPENLKPESLTKAVEIAIEIAKIVDEMDSI